MSQSRVNHGLGLATLPGDMSEIDGGWFPPSPSVLGCDITSSSSRGESGPAPFSIIAFKIEAASAFIFSSSDTPSLGLLGTELFGREEAPALYEGLLRDRCWRDFSIGEGLDSSLDMSPSE